MNPIKLFAVKNGELMAGGKKISAIAAKTGTPFYLYDAGIMRNQYRNLAAALPSGVFIHYSVKANPNKHVAAVFRDLGAGAEVASRAELATALEVGFHPEKIIFAGPGKSEADIALAVKKRIGSINVESRAELERILVALGGKRKKISNPVRVAFRVNLEFSGGDLGEVMIGGPRKFGTDGEAIEPLVREAMADGRLEVMGFHCFAGTQITNYKILAAMYEGFADWAEGAARRLKLNVKTLNFGGGLGIPYSEDAPELDVKKLGAALKGIKTRAGKSPYLKDAKFLLEPGRYLAGPSGVYVMKVIDIKRSRGKLFVITDGGIHHAIVPIVLNKNFPAATVNRMDEKASVECTVAGPLCASADQFSRQIKLPTPKIGDLIGLFNSGAYGFSAGMLYFLSHLTPAEALADGGKVYLVRKPSTPTHGDIKRVLW